MAVSPRVLRRDRVRRSKLQNEGRVLDQRLEPLGVDKNLLERECLVLLPGLETFLLVVQGPRLAIRPSAQTKLAAELACRFGRSPPVAGNFDGLSSWKAGVLLLKRCPKTVCCSRSTSIAVSMGRAPSVMSRGGRGSGNLGERERERARARARARQRQTETECHRHRDTETQRARERERERAR